MTYPTGIVIEDQPPTGGCTNCGAPNRTRRKGGWLCEPCQRLDDAPEPQALLRAIEEVSQWQDSRWRSRHALDALADTVLANRALKPTIDALTAVGTFDQGDGDERYVPCSSALQALRQYGTNAGIADPTALLARLVTCEVVACIGVLGDKSAGEVERARAVSSLRAVRGYLGVRDVPLLNTLNDVLTEHVGNSE